MNTLNHLSQSPVSVAPESFSYASRVHVSLRHGSLSFSHWCERSHLASRPLYVRCTLDRFSEGPKMKEEENGKKKNIVRGVGRASLVLACVLGAFTLSGKMMNPKPNIAYAVFQQDPSRCSVTGQKMKIFETEPDANEIEALKLWAMALSKKEQCRDVTERIMSNECKRSKKLEWHTSDQLRVAFIELLLHQEKYAKAKKEIEELLKEIEKNSGMVAAPVKKIYILKAIAEAGASGSNPVKAAESVKQDLDKLETSPFDVKPNPPSN